MFVHNHFSGVVHHINLELIEIREKTHKNIMFYKTPFLVVVKGTAFILTVTVIGQLIFSLAKNLYT